MNYWQWLQAYTCVVELILKWYLLLILTFISNLYFYLNQESTPVKVIFGRSIKGGTLR